ncbi:YggT family protein [Solibacillus daqui]|uniref:YggT family protein n=1 Tax=Solibacillus daqui TaxID=2912187 RepID=UPI0023661394|nr:YggT family protein [Solibacillus daqui]
MIIFGVISTVFLVYRYMLIGYILMSWVPALQESAVGRFLEQVCEPYLGFFRKFIPPIGMIDISPIVGLFVLYFIERGVFNVLSFLL